MVIVGVICMSQISAAFGVEKSQQLVQYKNRNFAGEKSYTVNDVSLGEIWRNFTITAEKEENKGGDQIKGLQENGDKENGQWTCGIVIIVLVGVVIALCIVIFVICGGDKMCKCLPLVRQESPETKNILMST
jgi:hypothetical protein